MQSNIHFFFTFCLLFCCSNGFNITSLLDQYPAFSTFNNYLTQTQLAGAINSRQTITVLVVSNDAISPFSGKPQDVLKKILSVHVIVDYFDVKKLQNLPNKTQSLVTLFQASGQATGEQGFLNATDLSTGTVVIGSAARGATMGANLVKSIAAQPYNISVLQVSTVIIPLGVDNSPNNSSSNSTSPSLSPMPATNATSPSPYPGPAPNSSSNSTSPSVSPTPMRTPTPTPEPARSPRKSLPPSPAPSNANAPGSPPMPADAPGSPPTPADAPGSPPMPADAPGAPPTTAAAQAPDNKPASEGTVPRVCAFHVTIAIVLFTFSSIANMI